LPKFNQFSLKKNFARGCGWIIAIGEQNSLEAVIICPNVQNKIFPNVGYSMANDKLGRRKIS